MNLLPGNYRVEVQNAGFKRYTREPIRIEVESAVRVDVALQVGDVAETMTVSDQAPLLQTQSGTIGKVIEGRTVQDTPLNGRNVLNLIALAPGVVPQGSTSGSPLGNQAGGTYTNNTGWGNYQIGGGMANQSAFYLDGAPLNTVNANSPGIVPSRTPFKNFALTATRQRRVRSFLRRRRKHGNQVWDQPVSCECLRIPAQSSPECKRLFQQPIGCGANSFTQNQYGITTGGPIVKDKFFFFASWENFALRNGKPTLTTVPTAAMKAGNFAGLPATYDPYTTCGLQGSRGMPGRPANPPAVPGQHNSRLKVRRHRRRADESLGSSQSAGQCQ